MACDDHKRTKFLKPQRKIELNISSCKNYIMHYFVFNCKTNPIKTY